MTCEKNFITKTVATVLLVILLIKVIVVLKVYISKKL